MQTIIMAGGTGTRLKEMTEFIPKPMIPIGGKPIIWHIMRLYAHYGHKDFILALGYKQELAKEYFTQFDIINNDISIELGRPSAEYCFHNKEDVGWQITLADTGVETIKGGRLLRVAKYIRGDCFFLTYGDSLSNVDIGALLYFHKAAGRKATVTGVAHPPRFGEIKYDGDVVTSFTEKPVKEECLINGGYMVIQTSALESLREGVELEDWLEELANERSLTVWHHEGYWRACDTLRDLNDLQLEWNSGKARWQIW